MFVWLLKPYIKPLGPVEISDTPDNNCCAMILIQQYTFKVKFLIITQIYIDGLEQNKCNSIDNILELYLSCIKPLAWTIIWHCWISVLLSTHDAQ